MEGGVEGGGKREKMLSSTCVCTLTSWTFSFASVWSKPNSVNVMSRYSLAIFGSEIS